MDVKYFLNGEYRSIGNPKVLPRIGERVIAAFLPGTCMVVDIVHDLNHGVVAVYLSY